LEKENARLKKIVAEQALDIDILKEVRLGETSEPGAEEESCGAREEEEVRDLRASGL